MEIPQLVRERLGDESIEASVTLGDEDLVCVTPTRTLVYRGEGLLSDESVSVYQHDVERFDVSTGRRKTKFVFEYVDGTESFTVPGGRADTLLNVLLGGVLHVAGVTGAGESISDVFSFSELTLVVTSHRLVKHVGEPVWDEDFEEYPYEDVTGLSFEEGSVATQVVLSVNGRPERIKAPAKEARKVEQTLTQALFAYHEVESLAEFDALVAEQDDQPESPSDRGGSSSDLSLEDGIAPLVGDDADDASDTGGAGSATPDSPTPDAPDSPQTGGSDSRAGEQGTTEANRGSGTTGGGRTDRRSSDEGTRSVDTVSSGTTAETGQRDSTDPGGVDPADIEAIEEQLSTLTTAVEKQNQLLRDQQETIEALIEELRRGR
jgi:hypothetical protein